MQTREKANHIEYRFGVSSEAKLLLSDSADIEHRKSNNPDEEEYDDYETSDEEHRRRYNNMTLDCNQTILDI